MGKDMTRAPEHSDEAWESQRERFTYLYRDLNKSLPEVQRTLRHETGFDATERQYKRRIKRWGLGKNSKAVEKKQALSALKRLDATLQTNCIYKLKGKDLAAHKLRRYARSVGRTIPRIARQTRTTIHNTASTNSEDPTAIVALLQESCRSRRRRPACVDVYEMFATMICAIWFEPVDVWSRLLGRKTMEDARPYHEPLEAILASSYPSKGFLKWTRTVLITTQLPIRNVLVAALYVDRLKRVNPTVIGNVGSEYRLATIALMLSNKYLDDNTYTNWTWAEVSGICLPEINIMELEFLSNMRYSLMVAVGRWETWCKELNHFYHLFRQPPKPTRVIEFPDVYNDNFDTSNEGCRGIDQEARPSPDDLQDSHAERSASMSEDSASDQGRLIDPLSSHSFQTTITHRPEPSSIGTTRTPEKTEAPMIGQAQTPGVFEPATSRERAQVTRHTSPKTCDQNPRKSHNATISIDIPSDTATTDSTHVASQNVVDIEMHNAPPVYSNTFHTERKTTLSDDLGTLAEVKQSLGAVNGDTTLESDEWEFLDTFSTSMMDPPLLPFNLAMELPPPEPDLNFGFLEYKRVDTNEIQQEPMPDLGELLDSSLWEDTWALPLSSWDPMQLTEDGNITHPHEANEG